MELSRCICRNIKRAFPHLYFLVNFNKWLGVGQRFYYLDSSLRISFKGHCYLFIFFKMENLLLYENFTGLPWCLSLSPWIEAICNWLLKRTNDIIKNYSLNFYEMGKGEDEKWCGAENNWEVTTLCHSDPWQVGDRAGLVGGISGGSVEVVDFGAYTFGSFLFL